MPLYDYRCPRCGNELYDVYQQLSDPNELRCPECLSLNPMKRIMRVNLGAPDLDTHHNVATGRVVHNRREFRDALKLQSDIMSERMGFSTNYEEVDRRDTDTLGVSGEGLEETARARHAQGQRLDMPT